MEGPHSLAGQKKKVKKTKSSLWKPENVQERANTCFEWMLQKSTDKKKRFRGQKQRTIDFKHFDHHSKNITVNRS